MRVEKFAKHNNVLIFKIYPLGNLNDTPFKVHIKATLTHFIVNMVATAKET